MSTGQRIGKNTYTAQAKLFVKDLCSFQSHRNPRLHLRPWTRHGEAIQLGPRWFCHRSHRIGALRLRFTFKPAGSPYLTPTALVTKLLGKAFGIPLAWNLQATGTVTAILESVHLFIL